MPLTSNSQPSEVTIRGSYFSGSDSARQDALLRSVGGIVVIDTGTATVPVSWPELTVSPRIGNTARYIHLPDDAVFETQDNDAVDLLSRQLHQGRPAGLIHRLESHLGLILTAIVVTLAVAFVTFVYGIPWTAGVVARSLPASVSVQMGESTLASLDRLWLEPTALSDVRQQQLQRYFAPYLSPVNGLPIRVVFRSSEMVGANAMALPDGTLIFTDDLVELAKHDDELVAILAHEIGHVAHRHGLQGVVQSSLALWLAVMMTGDLSAFSEVTATAPAVLMNLAYSRDMEREADDYALVTLRRNGIATAHFANIMKRLVDSQRDADDDEAKDSAWQGMGELLSTHPGTRERISKFEQPEG